MHMYNIDGFLFEDEAIAEIAKREEEGVRFIRERTNMDDPEVVYQLYNKLLKQELFVTPVGIRFLTELQHILYASAYVSKEEIQPIKVVPYVFPAPEPRQPVKEVAEKIDTRVGGEYKKPFYVALLFAIVFGLSVVGMFIIAEMSGNNVNILNYRTEILNEYASWEQELGEREKFLKDWETELEKKEEIYGEN